MPATTVAVVGPCASGKSTIVEGLRERGLDAYSVAQEHSVVGDLWRRREPDVVVYLAVTLETIRARRDNPNWPEWIYDLQEQRLEQARSNATFLIDTTTKTSDEIVAELGSAIGRSESAEDIER